MLDGSDAIADWPLLNGLVNTCSGATLGSVHHGGGVGIGRSIHAGQVSVADGTDLAAESCDHGAARVDQHRFAGEDRVDAARCIGDVATGSVGDHRASAEPGRRPKDTP